MRIKVEPETPDEAAALSGFKAMTAVGQAVIVAIGNEGEPLTQLVNLNNHMAMYKELQAASLVVGVMAATPILQKMQKPTQQPRIVAAPASAIPPPP